MPTEMPQRRPGNEEPALPYRRWLRGTPGGRRAHQLGDQRVEVRAAADRMPEPGEDQSIVDGEDQRPVAERKVVLAVLGEPVRGTRDVGAQLDDQCPPAELAG